MLEELHSHEKIVLVALGELGKASPDEISRKSGLGKNSVMRALYWLAPKGLIEIKEQADEIISLGEEGRVYSKKGFPERRAVEFLKKKGKAGVQELRKVLDKKEVSIAIGWLKKKDLAKFEDGKLVPSRKHVDGKTDDERLLAILEKGEVRKSELDKDMLNALGLLRPRQNVVVIKEKTLKEVSLSEKGRKLVRRGIEIEDEATQLTHEMLKTGSWKSKKFRGYDPHSMVPEVLPAKVHPIRNIIDEIREIFLNMGFKEITGPIVESCFWNFDALFVPQDHPAREMQDTFYLNTPGSAKLPKKAVIEAVSKAHEDGGKTGSVGWRYRWDKDIAKQTLLRTHTTATTIRYLATHEKPPIKVFSIDRVFRKEKMTFEHLPEFHQTEGIVVGDVTFRDLMGILKEFYARMGFEKVRFRPAYFPYTEPSLEIEVFFEDKNTWIELGGAGIFRPEVTEPLGISYPVLAWGLGLERLAMLRLDMTDIRSFYRSSIDWLRKVVVI